MANDDEWDENAGEELQVTPVSVETRTSDASLIDLAAASGVVVDPDPDPVTSTDQFTVEMQSAWGDRWTWGGVDANVSQEVFKMLGQPDVFERAGEADGTDPRHGGLHGPLVEES
jgi:hypothetical protein